MSEICDNRNHDGENTRELREVLLRCGAVDPRAGSDRVAREGAKMSDGMTLAGRVLKIEQRRNRAGDRTWMVVHVLADTVVYECSMGRDYNGPLPEKDQQAVWPVTVRAGKLAGGDVALYVDIVGEPLAEGLRAVKAG